MEIRLQYSRMYYA